MRSVPPPAQALAAALFLGVALTATAAVRLENARLAVEVDPESGAVRSVHPKDQPEAYRWSGSGFVIQSDGDTIRHSRATDLTRSEDTLTFRFREQGFEVRLFYRLGGDDAFVEKWVELKRTDGESFFLESVGLEEVDTGTAFREIHLHDDNTIWHCPINLFLRTEQGGCYAGLEYPWWDLELRGSGGFRLGYRPRVRVPAGATNVSERLFLGVYRREGIVRYSHGPYPGRVRARYLSFEGSGLSQHFKPMRIPPTAVEPEVLDWGEVWAMQAFMQRVLPEQPLPEDGYWVWQNGWWAGLFDPKPEILDHLKSAGVHDIMTAHTWYGRGNHPMPEPYLVKARPDPLGFPLDAGVASLPGAAGPSEGLHAAHAASLDPFKPGEYTPDFRAPPAVHAFWEHGRRLGVHVSSFGLPGIWLEQKPEWGSIGPDGRPSEYLFGRPVSCPASDGYMRFLVALHEAVFAKYQPRWWGWDGRWMSFWEVAGYRPGAEGVGPDPCYSTAHGHRPGDNFYAEWRNIMGFLAELRRRHPRMCFEQYLGLKRGGPWALRHLNADDNYFESNGADMNRFQTWHNQNDRFRPVHKNYAAMFGERPAEFQFNVLSTISTTTYGQIGPAFKGLAIEENRTFLRHWRTWATAHYEYLKVKRDLFGCPGFEPLDGSAHIVGDRGYLFLFPAGVHTADGALAARVRARAPRTRASIRLNHRLGLTPNAGAVFRLTELYPQADRSLGTWAYDAEFRYDMPRDSAVVIEIEPAPRDAAVQSAVWGTLEAGVELVPAFSAEPPPSARGFAGPPVLLVQLPFDTVNADETSTPNLAPPGGWVALNGLALTNGLLGKALSLDGRPRQGLDLGDLELESPATVAFWFKPAATARAFAGTSDLPEFETERARSQGRLLSQLAGATTQSGSLRLGPDQLELWDGTAWRVLVQRAFPAGEWIHLALVFNEAGAVTAYVNGQEGGNVTAAADFHGARLGLGAAFLNTYGHPFAGELDEVRIYRGALDAQAIASLLSRP